MDDIIKTKKSLENAGVLIKRVSEIVKHQIKNKKVDFFGVFFNFRYFNVRKYVSWERSHESCKM